MKSIDGSLLLSGCAFLAEAPLALGSGAGLRWRRKLASDEVADEYTVLPSCMHFGGTSATLSLTRDPIFFLADPSNQSPAFSATHPGHWDKLRGGHELVSFLHSVVDCSDIVKISNNFTASYNPTRIDRIRILGQYNQRLYHIGGGTAALVESESGVPAKNPVFLAL